MKSTFFICFVFIIGLSSCKSCNHGNEMHFTTQRQTIPPSAIYPEYTQLNVAQAEIRNYNPAAAPTRTYFIFKKSDLMSYISALNGDISYLHFLLGYDANLQATTLIICAMNKTKGHTYETNTGVDYVFAYNSASYGGINPKPFDLTAGDYISIPNGVVVDTVAYDSVKPMIDNYTPNVNNTALSFLVSAPDLVSYIKDGNIVALQVYLAKDFNRLTLVFVGLDANGKHVFMTDGNNNYYALEHCMPCPTCNVTLSGYNLEN
jgi:hypothetical protein